MITCNAVLAAIAGGLAVPEQERFVAEFARACAKASDSANQLRAGLEGARNEIAGVRPQTTVARASDGAWREIAESHVLRDFAYLVECLVLSADVQLHQGVADLTVGSAISAAGVATTFQAPPLLGPFQGVAWSIYLSRMEDETHVGPLRPGFWRRVQLSLTGGAIPVDDGHDRSNTALVLETIRQYGLKGRPITLRDLDRNGALNRTIRLIANYIWLQWQACPHRTPKALAGVRSQAILHFSSLFRDQSGPIIEWVNLICSCLSPSEKDF
jgi:hypothetical protein